MFENIKKYCELQKKFIEMIPDIIQEVANEARIESIKRAQEETPTTKTKGRNTQTSDMKACWLTDSDTKITREGNRYYFYLRNNKNYASYVDKGHSMNQHFVLGLYVNPFTNELEYMADKETAIKEGLGIMVGTKTSWVEGLRIVEKAKETFIDYIEKNLNNRLLEYKQKIFSSFY